VKPSPRRSRRRTGADTERAAQRAPAAKAAAPAEPVAAASRRPQPEDKLAADLTHAETIAIIARHPSIMESSAKQYQTGKTKYFTQFCKKAG
jgi:hypothetical protein